MLPCAMARWDALRKALKWLRPTRFRIGLWPCPACGKHLQVKLHDHEMAVRCAHCGASAVSQSILEVLIAQCPGIADLDALELSSRGPLARWLRQHAGSLVLSEYMPGQVPGTVVDGVRHEDVQQLSFADARFDLVTSTEVFEHVADDARGFAEVYRVLRPRGRFVFTVPLSDTPVTHERALVRDGEVVHLDTPAYHADSFSGSERVLCFRDYGRDIVDRLRAAGFEHARAVAPVHPMFGHARSVLVAEKGA